MIDGDEYQVERIALRLLDDAYGGWLRAEVDCEEALRAWSHEQAGVRAVAYVSYQAALDREEAAAHDLKRLWALAHPSRHGREPARSSVAPSHCASDATAPMAGGSVGGRSTREVGPWPVE